MRKLCSHSSIYRVNVLLFNSKADLKRRGFRPNFSMIPLTLNLLQGSVTFRFSPSAALDLQREINILLDRLKAIASNAASGGKPQPQKPLEYQHTGDVFLEVFCNPNIYPNPFSAKVLLTVRDDRLRLTTEAELTRVIEDLERYLDQNS